MTWQVIIPLLSVGVISLAFGYHLGDINGRKGKCKDKKLLGFPVDGCFYEDVEIWRNVTVIVCKCKRCGHRDILWKRQPNSEMIYKRQEG